MRASIGRQPSALKPRLTTSGVGLGLVQVFVPSTKEFIMLPVYTTRQPWNLKSPFHYSHLSLR